jgi:hypothetical protein
VSDADKVFAAIEEYVAAKVDLAIEELRASLGHGNDDYGTASEWLRADEAAKRLRRALDGNFDDEGSPS